jgi:hypothetical protein
MQHAPSKHCIQVIGLITVQGSSAALAYQESEHHVTHRKQIQPECDQHNRRKK